jgi:hypothetical protein
MMAEENSSWTGDGPLKVFRMGMWSKRALAYALQACGEIEDGTDAIPALDAAIAALRIEAGELDPDELGGPGMHELPEWMASQAGYRQLLGLPEPEPEAT